MGEALMIKTIGYKEYNPLDDVVISEGRSAVLVRVLDSDGGVVPNISVNCKDGSTWYNYSTNENGMCIFQCNSGSANITAQNFSSSAGFVVLDQTPTAVNLDAPVGSKNSIDIKLTKVSGTITIDKNTNNARFLVTDKINVQILGGGGYGGYDYVGGTTVIKASYGGGGGAYNQVNGYILDKNALYNIIIGSGAVPSDTVWNSTATSGGTTSAFGISAVGGQGRNGGGSGSYRGGNGGNGFWHLNTLSDFPSNANGTNANYANNSFPYGGGAHGLANFIRCNIGDNSFQNRSGLGGAYMYYITNDGKYASASYGGGGHSSSNGGNGVCFITL